MIHVSSSIKLELIVFNDDKPTTSVLQNILINFSSYGS